MRAQILTLGGLSPWGDGSPSEQPDCEGCGRGPQQEHRSGRVPVTSSNVEEYDVSDLKVFEFELSAQEMATLSAL